MDNLSINISAEIKDKQDALNSYLLYLDSAEGPTYYTYPSLVAYLKYPMKNISAFNDTLLTISKKIIEIANGSPIYFVDNLLFVGELIQLEYPELKIFLISADEAFVESKVQPGLWLETKKFADLHILSRMRRELKKTGFHDSYKIVDMVKILLGL